MFLVFFVFLFVLGTLFFLKSGYVQAQGGDQSYADWASTAAATDPNTNDVCGWGQWLRYAPICFLLSLLNFVGYLLGGANTLFVNMVQVGNFSRVANDPTIYRIWERVRDLLNIAFILVLLFSAFATIFQVEKYSYKKILLRLVIMALLVNFSFPIARFIVDVGNSLMYTLIALLFPTSGTAPNAGITGVFAGMTNSAGLANGLSPATASASGLVTAIIFNFILAFSLLALGVLLTIRTVALVILIILSPVAFVGAILPDTGGFASKWWDNLFRYTFFGPMMIFMIYIANEFMRISRAQWAAGFIRTAGQNSVAPNIVGDIAFFAIPIVLLWAGMGIAQSMSITGAGMVMGYSQKMMKWGAAAPVRATWWGIKKTGVPGGAKQVVQDLRTRGPLGSAATAKREAWLASKLGVKGAQESDIKRRAEEYKKNNESKESLRAKASAGDAAAAYRLALDGDIDAPTYESFMNKIKDPKVRELIEGKTKDKRVDTMIHYKIKTETDAEAAKIAAKIGVPINDSIKQEASMLIADREIGKIAPSKWKDQDSNELLGFDKDKNEFKRDRSSQILRQELRRMYRRQNKKNQEKITDDMNDAFYAKGKKARIWP